MGCGCNNTWFIFLILILFCCGDCGGNSCGCNNNNTFSNRGNDCGCGCGC